MTDLVNHPPHYTSNPFGLETIEITRHYNFDVGNALKYILRAGKKGDDGRGNELGPLDEAAAKVKDLRKAIWYLEDEVAQIRSQYTGWNLDDLYSPPVDVAVMDTDGRITAEDGSDLPPGDYTMVVGEEQAWQMFLRDYPQAAASVLAGYSPKPRHRDNTREVDAEQKLTH